MSKPVTRQTTRSVLTISWRSLRRYAVFAISSKSSRKSGSTPSAKRRDFSVGGLQRIEKRCLAAADNFHLPADAAIPATPLTGTWPPVLADRVRVFEARRQRSWAQALRQVDDQPCAGSIILSSIELARVAFEAKYDLSLRE